MCITPVSRFHKLQNRSHIYAHDNKDIRTSAAAKDVERIGR